MRFKNAQVGDKVYCRLYGFGEIVKINTNREDCIGVNSESFLLTYYYPCGKLSESHKESTLFYVDGENIYSEIRPIQTIQGSIIPIDTKVYVSNFDAIKSKYPRYFAGVSSKFIAFDYGTTSFTYDNKSGWDFMELAEELNIEGITYSIGTKVVI